MRRRPSKFNSGSVGEEVANMARASQETHRTARCPSLDDYDDAPRRLLGHTDIRLWVGFAEINETENGPQ